MVGTAMLIGMAAASAAGGIASSAINARAAGNAAKTQSKATDKALAFNQNAWDQIRGMNEPYLQGGTNSMNMLSSLMQPSGAPGGYRPGMPPRPGLGSPPPTAMTPRATSRVPMPTGPRPSMWDNIRGMG